MEAGAAALRPAPVAISPGGHGGFAEPPTDTARHATSRRPAQELGVGEGGGGRVPLSNVASLSSVASLVASISSDELSSKVLQRSSCMLLSTSLLGHTIHTTHLLRHTLPASTQGLFMEKMGAKPM